MLLVLFYATALPVIFFNRGASSRAAADQHDYHLPVIRQFIEQWPHPDLSDYVSSTTPGYHLVVAMIGRYTRADTISVRLIGSFFTAGLFLTLGLAVGRRATALEAVAVCLPMLASVYVFSSGAFLLPENAGWWGVLCILLIALEGHFNRYTFLLAGTTLLGLVLVRQNHLWIAAPLLAAAYLKRFSHRRRDVACVGSASAGAEISVAMARNSTPVRPARSASAKAEPTSGRVTNDPRAKVQNLRRFYVAWMLLAIAPAVLAVAWFHHLWHGNLVPPNQVSLTTGGNGTAPAVILAIAGIIAPFFCGFVSQRMTYPRLSRALIGAIVGAIIAAIPRSTYDLQARRYSGIWNLVNHVPYIFNRSPLLIALAAVGGAAVVIWLSALPKRDRLIWGTAFAAFTIFQTLSANPWQRYYEPFILMAAALTAPVIARRDGGQPARWALLGPLMLAFLLGAVTFLAMAGKS